jgi:hypothetical protein
MKSACSVLLLMAVSVMPQQGAWEAANSAGKAAFEARRFGEAQKYFSAAVQEAEKFGPNDMRLASSLSNLGRVCLLQGRFGDAAKLLRRSAEIIERVLGPDDLLLAATLEELAQVVALREEQDKALQLLDRAAAIRERTAPQAPETVARLFSLARQYERFARRVHVTPAPLITNEPPRGVMTTEERAERTRTLGGFSGPPTSLAPTGRTPMTASPAEVGGSWPQISWDERDYDRKKLERAESVYRRALALQQGSPRRDARNEFAVLESVARTALLQGKASEARKVYAETLTKIEAAEGQSSPRLAAFLEGLARVEMGLQQPAEAEALLKRALALREELFGADDPRLLGILQQYAAVLKQLKRTAEAREVEARAARIAGAVRR